MDSDDGPVEATDAPRTLPEFAAMSFAVARPAGGLAQPMPPTLVPVRAYAGETEEEALERQGIKGVELGRELTFIHLD